MTEPERLELITRLMNYHDQVLIGFRHISRLEEAELIQAAIEALRPRVDGPTASELSDGSCYPCGHRKNERGAAPDACPVCAVFVTYLTPGTKG